MKVEGRIFLYIAVFAFVMAVVYAVWAKFVATRLEQPRPEDNPRAEISDGAGEVGFFSPGSYWPIVLALSAAVVGVALAFWLVWLLVAGIIFVLVMVGGLVFEYHIGPNHD